jgi:protein O-mannosyl-transferase
VEPERHPGKTRFPINLRSTWLHCLLLAVAGFAVHVPALQGELLWDDQYLLRNNPFIKSPLLIFETFRHHLFLDSFSGHYRPVQNISFILDYFIWNTNAYGFHLTNVLLHVASGVLLYFLLQKLLVSLWNSGSKTASIPSLAAFLVAFLWMVHPVHSAAVDYISGRADSLAFLFASAGWLLVFRAQGAASKVARFALYGSAACCGLMALCSREIAAIWFVLFLVHLLFFNKLISHRTKLISLGCCIALVAIYAGLRQLPERRPGSGPSHSFSVPTRAVLMLRALGDYGRLMVFPSNLHMERTVFDGDNYRSDNSWRKSARSDYLSLLGLIVAAALLYGSLRKGAGRPLRIFGASWFVLGYLPISNIVDLGATAAEHWLYLPSVGFLIFFAGCTIDLPSRYRKMAGALATVAIVGLSIRSLLRSSDWVTPQTFFERTMAAGGVSTRVAVNLGQIYANEGRYAEAEGIFRKVLSISPDYPFACNDLAAVLYRQGKKDEANAIFSATRKAAAETRKTYSLTWISILTMARVCHEEKQDNEALAILEKARVDYPQVWELISLESEILRLRNEPDRALRIVGDFARKHWWHYGASIALGRLYASKGDSVSAEAALRQASWLDVHDVEALDLIATIQLRQNRLAEARQTLRRAVSRQPDEPRQYAMLSDILEKMGRAVEARAAIAEVSRLQAITN